MLESLFYIEIKISISLHFLCDQGNFNYETIFHHHILISTDDVAFSNFTIISCSVSPSHCLQHEESMVELQALTYNQQQRSHR